MVGTKVNGIRVIRPYKTKAAAVKTLENLKATRTHRVVLQRDGLYTIRKRIKGGGGMAARKMKRKAGRPKAKRTTKRTIRRRR